MGDALLTFSIGPVHSFIAQARRVADLWAGSALLSHLISQAIATVHQEPEAKMLFPTVPRGQPMPEGLPNRFVCRVPQDRATDIAEAMEAAVRAEWRRWARETVAFLSAKPYRFAISTEIWRDPLPREGIDQIEAALECSWSWVPESPSYAEASVGGAQQFAASRLFRPFAPRAEPGEKCAICGERAALPDGVRSEVKKVWARAAQAESKRQERGFLRLDQTRLCLVCATKRLFPFLSQKDPARFRSFQDFEPPPPKDAPREQEGSDEPAEVPRVPYFALVAMDGDHMGQILGWSRERVQGEVEVFHREVSRALNRFAGSLRRERSQELNLDILTFPDLERYEPQGTKPQLIYAGGEDVLLVCDPRDALPLARRIERRYREGFRERVFPLLADPALERCFTISAGVLIAHTKHPAGLLLRDVEELLKTKAKGEGGRDAVAIRLVKRSGVPVEVVFQWGGEARAGRTWAEAFEDLTARVRKPGLASRQTFRVRREEETLHEIFASKDAQEERGRWQRWLAEALSRGEHSAKDAEKLAMELAPFFVARKTGALRIARFFGQEVAR